MNREPIADRVGAASVLGFLTGPTVAGLHEANVLSIRATATLWPIALVVFAAALGVLIGIWIVRRGSKWAGFVVALPNVVVLSLYGFLLAFFGLGGSR